jgi:hypothetical protein
MPEPTLIDGLHHHWILRDDPLEVGDRVIEEGYSGQPVTFVVALCRWGENVWPNQWGIWLELECDWVEEQQWLINFIRQSLEDRQFRSSIPSRFNREWPV